MFSGVGKADTGVMRLAEVVDWRSYAWTLPDANFDERTPVLVARPQDRHWRLSEDLQEAFSVTVESYFRVPFLVLRYQHGATQAVFVGDAAESALWSCVEGWSARGRAQVLLVEPDGTSTQSPDFAGISAELKDRGRLASGASAKMLLAAMAVGIVDGEVARRSASLIPGVQLQQTEVFGIKSRRLVAGQNSHARVVNEVDWTRQQTKH